MPTEFVRVKDPDTKHEYTVAKRFAEANKLTVLDKKAVDPNGRPLPGKSNVDLDRAEPPKSNDEGGSDSTPSPSSSTTPNRSGARL